jgi:hypothetical protein
MAPFALSMRSTLKGGTAPQRRSRARRQPYLVPSVHSRQPLKDYPSGAEVLRHHNPELTSPRSHECPGGGSCRRGTPEQRVLRLPGVRVDRLDGVGPAAALCSARSTLF